MAPGGMGDPLACSDTAGAGSLTYILSGTSRGHGIIYRSAYTIEWPTTGSRWNSPAWWGNSIGSACISPEKHRERWNAYYHTTIVKVPRVREVWPQAKKISPPHVRLRIPCLAAQRKAPVTRAVRAMRNQIKQLTKSRPEHRPI
jgi:hypothetical protein